VRQKRWWAPGHGNLRYVLEAYSMARDGKWHLTDVYNQRLQPYVLCGLARDALERCSSAGGPPAQHALLRTSGPAWLLVHRHVSAVPVGCAVPPKSSCHTQAAPEAEAPAAVAAPLAIGAAAAATGAPASAAAAVAGAAGGLQAGGVAAAAAGGAAVGAAAAAAATAETAAALAAEGGGDSGETGASGSAADSDSMTRKVARSPDHLLRWYVI